MKISVFDSWAKVQAGLLQGNSQNFGFFSSCVKIRREISRVETLQGQHCMVTFKAKENTTNEAPTDNIFDWSEV